MSTETKSIRKIMIVGLPNTGKSQIFINLTGKFTVVANSPLTTIEMKRALLELENDDVFEVIDTPGLFGFFAHSEEEIMVREAIFSEKPDIIIQCIDANRLKQSLFLTSELILTRIPMVISLNAVDEIARKGIQIDADGLSRLLDVPVVESVAVAGHGIKELKEAIPSARPGKIDAIRHGGVIDQGVILLESKLPKNIPFPLVVATLLMMRDPFIVDYLREYCDGATLASIQKEIDHLIGQFRGNLSRVINTRRSRWIDNLAEQIVKQDKAFPRESYETIARLTRHPIFGPPILLAILAIVFLAVVYVANGISEWMNQALWTPVEAALTQILPSGFWNDFFIGQYGILSMGLANALLTVLPILSVFLLLFNILEDTGYIPNLSVLTKRILGKLGLGGEALIPLVLGFGCKTMATLTARTIPSKRERYIVIFLIAFAIPCSSQLGLSMSLLGRIGWSAFVIVFGILTFSEIGAGLLLNRILKKHEKNLIFIQELPPIRLPNPKWVLKKTYFRLYWFLQEALLIFVLAAVGLFALDKLGILDVIRTLLRPLIEGWLGLPLDMVDAIILCLARNEAAVGFMINLARKSQLDYIQCIVAVVLTTMSFPCFANITAMAKEIGAKSAAIMVAIIVVTAFFMAGLLNRILLALI
ncbi:MAG: ferrous iron transporter B [Deltaproteobacteria bacterium]|nr:ferrous iron transporter B [Deltaproteobacteria bacterium]